jgi:hypothetical protein
MKLHRDVLEEQLFGVDPRRSFAECLRVCQFDTKDVEADWSCPFQKLHVQYLNLHRSKARENVVASQIRAVIVTREAFLEHPLGRTFADVAKDSGRLFEEVLSFFGSRDRQQRMEDAEIHHDRPPLAGVVRELESLPAVDRFLSGVHPRRSKRLRQAIGVVVRIIMEGRGWQKTGRKGSLGVRTPASSRQPGHNTGGLAFWFIRAERYERLSGMPFRSVRERNGELQPIRRYRTSMQKRVRNPDTAAPQR